MSKKNRWSGILGYAVFALFLTGCGGGPDVCSCNEEALKENPDKALIEECRKMLSKMETRDIIKAVDECAEQALPDEPPKELENMM